MTSVCAVRTGSGICGYVVEEEGPGVVWRGKGRGLCGGGRDGGCVEGEGLWVVWRRKGRGLCGGGRAGRLCVLAEMCPAQWVALHTTPFIKEDVVL